MGKLIPEMTRGFQVSQAHPGKDGLEHGLKTMTRVRVSQLQHCQNPPEALLKHNSQGPSLEFLIHCIWNEVSNLHPNKFPGKADVLLGLL